MDFIIKPRAEYEIDDKLKALRGKIDTLTPEEYSLFQSMLTEDGISPERIALLESCIYKRRPPTPEEFLDWREGWLPKDFCDSIREWVRDSFCNISDPKLRYNNNKYNTVCFYGATRCEAKGTKILMWDMSVKNIEDVVVGDLLMGDDSKPRTVISLHKGHGKLYKVKQASGDDYIVNEDHILVLYDSIKNEIIEISVRDYLKRDTKYLFGIKATLTGYDPGYKKITMIDVSEYEEGDFYGFELDGNHRYLHSDLTITHNTGKSFWAVLQMLYTIVYLAHLRDVRGYYKLAPNTVLSMFILSFDLAKVKEVYLEPLYNLMLQSERFEKVQFQDTVADRQHKAGMDKIIYSKATNVGHITLASGLKLVSGNDDVLKIIGSNILSAYISEIAFFIESAGASEESIFRIYSDVSERIKATMGRKAYLSFTYLDSSANISDSQIESHILKEIRYKDNAYFKWFKRWDVVETHDKYFPIWKETGETFPVCVGDGKNPARILQPHEVKTVPADLVEWVPIDSKEEMLINPLKTIKDVIGRPTVKESKFIQDPLLIDRIFDTELVNIESSIMADTDSMPELLIWSQFPVDKYFRKLAHGELSIKRSPNEPRFLGFDLAKSSKGDVVGLSMCHWEWSREQEAKILVYDFSFAITPGDNGINLKAVTEFVLDLIRLGNVGIIGGYVDTALSDELQQNLNREIKREHNKFIEANSVDRSPNDYQALLSLMFNNRVRVGRNIFLKNNLNCLERVFDSKGREKIDHPKGDTFNVYDGLWETSKVGRNAKDVSDSMAQACSFALTKKIDVSSAIYEEQNELFGTVPVKTVDKKKLASAFKLVLPNVVK